MPMSTPIEIVREMQLWRRGEGRFADDRERGVFKAIELMPYTPQQFGKALDTVLRDAERYTALELASEVEQTTVEEGVIITAYEVHREGSYETLAELADRLKNEGTK